MEETEGMDKDSVVGYEYSAVWPLAGAVVPEEIPSPVWLAVADAKRAYGAGAEIGVLLAGRTAIIRMQRNLGVSSLKALYESGKITQLLYEQSDQVRLWANDFGHEKLLQETPDRDDVEELLEYLDALLDVLYVQPNRLLRLRKQRQNRSQISTQ